MANNSSPRSAADGTDAGLEERRVTAWIGKSLRIDGHIVSDDNLTIDGNVEGTIGVGDYSLTVGPGATVKADLTARKITVSGAVIGKVRAHELLDLRATGSVVGEMSQAVYVWWTARSSMDRSTLAAPVWGIDRLLGDFGDAGTAAALYQRTQALRFGVSAFNAVL